MANLTEKEILEELEKIGIDNPSELTNYFKEYLAYLLVRNPKQN